MQALGVAILVTVVFGSLCRRARKVSSVTGMGAAIFATVLGFGFVSGAGSGVESAVEDGMESGAESGVWRKQSGVESRVECGE